MHLSTKIREVLNCRARAVVLAEHYRQAASIGLRWWGLPVRISSGSHRCHHHCESGRSDCPGCCCCCRCQSGRCLLCMGDDEGGWRGWTCLMYWLLGWHWRKRARATEVVTLPSVLVLVLPSVTHRTEAEARERASEARTACSDGVWACIPAMGIPFARGGPHHYRCPAAEAIDIAPSSCCCSR